MNVVLTISDKNKNDESHRMSGRMENVKKIEKKKKSRMYKFKNVQITMRTYIQL